MGTIIFAGTGHQYRVDVDMIEGMARDYSVTRKRTNGSQAQFWMQSEYPASVVVNVHSEAYEILNNAYQRDRKEGQ